MDYNLKSFDMALCVPRIANIHYFEFTNQYHTKGDYHDFCELLYVDNGSVNIHAENFTGVLSDNQLIIHRPNEVHSLACDTDIAPNVIIIGFECNCDALVQFSYAPATLSSEHKNMLAEIMKEAMNVYAPPYDLPNTSDMKKRADYPFGADQMIKLRLETFLITLVRSCLEPSSAQSTGIAAVNGIAAVHQYVTEHYKEKIVLDNLCFLFGTNKTTLCSSFKAEYGTTILNYINDLKIKDAKTLLRENKLSITEISERLGFGSIHYFCRLFKKKTGHSPKEYVKMIRSRLNL